MKKILIFIVLIISANVFADISKIKTEISCKINGRQDKENGKYQILVKGKFSYTPDQIESSDLVDGGCVPKYIESEKFGEEGGTRLLITALKCGSSDAYHIATLWIDGQKLNLSLSDGKYSRLLLNDDFADKDDIRPSIVTPEGKFRFIYFDCQKAQSTTIKTSGAKTKKEGTELNFLKTELQHYLGISSEEANNAIKNIIKTKSNK